MVWLLLYVGSLIVYPPAALAVLILHLLSMGEKRISRKRQSDVEKAVTKALDNRRQS